MRSQRKLDPTTLHGLDACFRMISDEAIALVCTSRVRCLGLSTPRRSDATIQWGWWPPEDVRKAPGCGKARNAAKSGR
jgi:hypothetical protein